MSRYFVAKYIPVGEKYFRVSRYFVALKYTSWKEIRVKITIMISCKDVYYYYTTYNSNIILSCPGATASAQHDSTPARVPGCECLRDPLCDIYPCPY